MSIEEEAGPQIVKMKQFAVDANDKGLLSMFPYVGLPHQGYESHT